MKILEEIRIFIRTNSVTIAVLIIFVSLTGVILLESIALGTLTEQAKKQNELLIQIKQNAEDRTKQIESVDKHLDCVVQFFSQPDRSQKAIKNIDECRIAANAVKQDPAVKAKQNEPTTNASVTQKQPSKKAKKATQQPAKQQPTFIDKLIAPIKRMIGVN